MESNEHFIVTLNNEGELTLLLTNEEPRFLKIKRDCHLYKVCTFEKHIVVVGWNEDAKEASYLLYDDQLRFRDEIRIKHCKLFLNQVDIPRSVKLKKAHNFLHVFSLNLNKITILAISD